MTEKTKFFQLTAAHQLRLRSLMALLAASNLLQALLSLSATGSLSPLITIAANVAILYCTAFITKAPDYYFRLIVWIVVVVVIFDGLSLSAVLMGRSAITARDVLSLVDVISVAVFARSLLAYRAGSGAPTSGG